MHIRKRWLAFMLTTAIALSECGGMTVFATEDAVTGETTVSENTTVSDEISEDGNLTPEPEASEEDAENQKDEAGDISSDTSVQDAAPKEKLPALHIGQISKGDTLPSADDDAFHYDLPISFTSTKNLILFVNYAVETMPETEETGELEWSILRGKKGLEAGSTTLLDEEDDWNGFETVSSSPYFSMEEMADTEDAYYRMLAPAPEEVFSAVDESENHASEETAENYDYYIRAAYYPQTKNEKAEDFYAAATIPFVPRNDTTADTDRITEDAADTEKNPTGTASEDASVSENSTDANDRESSGDDLMEDDAATPEGSGTDSAPEGTESENAGEEQAAEPASTLSENSATADAVTLADGNELPPLEKEANGSLVLYKGVGTDDENIIDRKERITMSPGDTQQITAKAVPDMAQADFVWESSDEAVATVTKGENGSATVTAAGEGFVTITASCHGITAFAVIDVVLDKTNPDNDKLLDLSGDIRVAGFEKESDKLVYSGQKITQNLRVYHKDTLLTEKTDYTLSYKNNINAAAWNSAKAPSVTINLKGQYQGSVTLYYTIKPLDINNIDIYNTPKVSPGYEQTVNYSKKLNIPAPVLTYGKKKLAVKKDFICDYTTPGENMTPLPADYKNGDLYEAGKVYSYTVNGTGNFTGSFP
ncbi:MAG: Ig-like domain-containing protein, partial [Lachnospiraceae bacterium]|nr:Ig-like domain-containing protein [Lachnospiraceae bacterium]